MLSEATSSIVALHIGHSISCFEHLWQNPLQKIIQLLHYIIIEINSNLNMQLYVTYGYMAVTSLMPFDQNIMYRNLP